MKIFSKRVLSFVCTSLLVLSSCKKYEDLKKISSTAWNPNLAVPLAHAIFDVYDILAATDSSDLIIIDPNSGEIGLIYSSEIGSFGSTEIVDLGNIVENISINTINLNIPTTPALFGTINSSNPQIIQLNTANGVEVHKVLFKTGTLNLHFESSVQQNLDVTITFPSLLDANGNQIVRTINAIYSGTVPQVADLQIELTGLSGDFTLSNTTFNQMEIDVETTITGTGQPVFGAETFNFNVTSSNFSFENVIGYFGQQNVAQQADSVLIKIFQNATDGVFELQNPKIDFFIDNSFGFPVDIQLNNLKSINVNTNQIVPLGLNNNIINVNPSTGFGQSANTNFQLNTSNTTNLSAVISPTPKYFFYEIDATANPQGNTGIPNFIEDDSKFTLRAEVNMPLDGFAYGFTISDTVDFEFNQNTDLIESIMFRLIADNGFPVQLGTQLRAVDANGNTVFTIFDMPENVVEPAPVNANGIVSASRQKITDINLNDVQINQLKDVKKLIIYGEASTTESQNGVYVKFFDYYKFGLKVAMQVQGSTSF